MSHRKRIDLGVALVVIALGLGLGLEAWRIDPSSYEAVGPRAVPLFLCAAMVLLGALVGVGALTGGGADDDPSFGFRDSDLPRVAAVIGAGAVYAFVFWAAGYLVATVVGAALAFVAFGVRSPLVVIGGAVAAGIVYQLVFMGLMGLLDPRGALIDLRDLSHLITPGS